MKSELGDPIATAALVLVRPGGERVAITVKIGRPYVVDELEARCPVAIEGLEAQYVDISGSSTLHALGLALKLVRLRLEDQVLKGCRLLEILDDEEEAEGDADLDSLFGPR